jgi:RNA-directed DNA polymerase
MYVATAPDREWLLNVQRTLYRRSWETPNYFFRKLWGHITDPRNLRLALARVARNKGHRTAGVDGVTVRRLIQTVGAETFVAQLRAELRSGAYRPSPVRRVLIPKAGKPGKFRPLGIPTVADRVVQAAVKAILEPIFEADFYPVSYGFRPRRSVHAALEHIRSLLRPKGDPREPDPDKRLPYQVALEGDIKGCFDNISHHALMNRVRRRIGDPKTTRLIRAFLKAGVLAEECFLRSDSGTPQGGILSPLLANVALSAIEERYERHVWPRQTPTLLTEKAEVTNRADRARRTDRGRSKAVLFPVRYADDFLILVSVPPGPDRVARALTVAHQERAALAEFLEETLGLVLSEEKTLVTPVTQPIRFLGHHVRVRRHPTHKRWVSTAVLPRERSQDLRRLIKAHFGRNTLNSELSDRLRTLNLKLSGWARFYRHAWGAKHVFKALDSYTWWTILRWLRKKHRRPSMKFLESRYGWTKPGCHAMLWQHNGVHHFRMDAIPVEPYRLAWLTPPDFAVKSMESPVRNERRTPGSGKGAS